jgi:hypothetical protein
MRTHPIFVFMVALGCASANDEPPAGPFGAAGAGGSLPTSGGTGNGGAAGASIAGASGGGRGGGGGTSGTPGGGMPSAGAFGTPMGGAAGDGGSSAAAPNGGSSAGIANGGSSAGIGNGGSSAGIANGGIAGFAGTGGVSGAGATAGGGAAGCVENLGCELSPPPSTGDIHQDCVDRINQFLTQCACLPPLTRRTDGEACADQMAKYDADNDSAHAGIRAGICEPGGSQNSCPGYSSNQQVVGLCMQQMWDEGPPPTSDCTGACYQEHGHFINMTDPSVTKVACGFFTTSAGKVWAVQNFSR